MELKKIKANKNLSDSLPSFLFFLSCFGIGMYFAAKKFNPDNDAFWLIETGRWIIENKKLPLINPWSHEKNMEIVIQSPLCAVLNYVWSNYMGGLSSLWQLALIENILMMLSVYNFSYYFTKNKTHTFLVCGLFELFFIVLGIINTRPYQLTTAMMALLLFVLYRFDLRKDYLKYVLFVSGITIWQANYQMASLLIIPCFISCFFVGDILSSVIYNEIILNKKELIKWLSIYLLWGIIALFSPYKIKGLMYLVNSSEALSVLQGKLIEMNPPSMKSLSFILVISSILLYHFLESKKEKKDIATGLLVYGCSLTTYLAIRNTWMIMLAFVVVYSKILIMFKNVNLLDDTLKNNTYISKIIKIYKKKKATKRRDKKENIFYKIIERYKKEIDVLFSFSISILAIFLLFDVYNISIPLAKDKIKDVEKIIEVLDDVDGNKTAKIFTSFNTGGLIEYTGRKMYIDARPELYSPQITNLKKDVLNEWLDVEWNNPKDILEYVEEKDWEYYYIGKDTPIYYALLYSGKGSLLIENDYGVLFKVK